MDDDTWIKRSLLYFRFTSIRISRIVDDGPGHMEQKCLFSDSDEKTNWFFRDAIIFYNSPENS